MYYIYNFIKQGNVTVNNKVILNPNFVVPLMHNVSFLKSLFKKLFLLFKLRLKKKSVFFNYPVKYMEIDYNILTAAIWRIPDSKDIIGPYDFPFKTFSYDWLLYKQII